MREFTSMGMAIDNGKLKILDQTLLPHEKKWLSCENVDALIEMIQRLAIRGAPAIGISSSLLLAILAEHGHSREQLIKDGVRLKESRPTAVNLMNNIDRVLEKVSENDYPSSVIREAESIYLEDVDLCEKMSRLGADIIKKNESILTHCNTGGLATAGIGTAMGVIRTAHEDGKNITVFVDETRPLLQGGRLTSWECGELGISHVVICDSSAAMLMKAGKVDRVFVGSDRIATNGDFANKIGTYSLAVLAHYHDVPFYVVAPRTTIDPECFSGKDIPIEERDASEVLGITGGLCSYTWAPEKSPAYNPAFDVTPAELVTGWVLDTGVFTFNDLQHANWWMC